ncbi:MAG: hypothetical protein EOO15_12205 [Chitinophagaceae bacterium]|nr:MAG: hypothetical protein EOO15_12205 [Chitinophagaceae bacterium]
MNPTYRKGASLLLLHLLLVATLSAQSLLNRSITIDVNRQRLDQVLEIISNKGNFYFSYNSNSIRRDSLVSLSTTAPLRELLERLFPDHFEFRESGNYIIIRRAPIKVTLITEKATISDRYFLVSGYVLDDETGHQIPYASVYEKRLLLSALTNQQGYFRLKLKERKRSLQLTVSKEAYEDTTVRVDPGMNQQITVTIVPITVGPTTIVSPDDYFAPEQIQVQVPRDSGFMVYTYQKTDSFRVERTAMGKFLLSAGQKFQTINLRRFFTTRPYQVSLVPGLGTHGALSPQVINNFSFNVLGGYNGGVNGVEIGGLFNIDKKSVRYGQLAGLFNIVGGPMRGVQVAGISNTVLDSTSGFQLGGVTNFVRGRFRGVQLGGVANLTTRRLQGIQLAGVYNHADSVNGLQLAGVANFTSRSVQGTQVSGVINYARRVKGMQIGLINIADTVDGVQLGLINIALKGYHKLSFWSDEVVPLNAGFKTGGRRLYSILFAGFNPIQDSADVFSFGYGIGSDLPLGKVFSISPELTAQHLYLGSWDYANILSRARINMNIRLGKLVTLFGGPVYNVYYSRQPFTVAGYKAPVMQQRTAMHSYNNNVTGWLGWNAGISFF